MQGELVTLEKVARKAGRRLLRPRPFLRASPNPVEPPSPGSTTLTWDSGDGRAAIIAYVKSESGELIPIGASPSGSVQVTWIQANKPFRFNLYDIEDWLQRDSRRLRPRTGTTVTMVPNERREVLADLAVLGIGLGAAILAVLVALKLFMTVWRSLGGTGHVIAQPVERANKR